jgi:hypothetical protein
LSELRGDVFNEITFLARAIKGHSRFSLIFSWLLFLSLSTKAFALISNARFGKSVGGLPQKTQKARQPIKNEFKSIERNLASPVYLDLRTANTESG